LLHSKTDNPAKGKKTFALVSKMPVYHQKPAVGNCYSNATSYTTENQRNPNEENAPRRRALLL
jgi:hypothetical protein